MTAQQGATVVAYQSKSMEHYTPSLLIQAAREVLGGIDLDPASCALANTTVRADRYYSREDDGLSKPWSGRVWLNPPGGRRGCISEAKGWWVRLARDYAAGDVTSALFLGFNMQLLQTAQVCRPRPASLPSDHPLCLFSRRIRFLRGTEEGQLKPGNTCTFASVLVYLPDRSDRGAVERFRRVFAPFGVMLGVGS